MGQPGKPAPVRLVIGLLSESNQHAKIASCALEELWGSASKNMECIPFTWTNYYQSEVGDSPVRSFLSFDALIERDTLPEIKLKTNELELTLFEGKRRVNLDPGYLTLGQFFLASVKDQRQRVYIRDGIYIEPTLFFQNEEYRPFPWTYRDYASPEYRNYLLDVRQEYYGQIRS